MMMFPDESYWHSDDLPGDPHQSLDDPVSTIANRLEHALAP